MCLNNHCKLPILFSAVVKPYEPPGLGKPSRVTPVGLDEDPADVMSTDSILESDTVEVLSVIRYNKNKLGTSSTGTSDKRSSSSADTNSLFNSTNLPCPACDAASAAAAAAAASKRVRSRSATRAESSSAAASSSSVVSGSATMGRIGHDPHDPHGLHHVGSGVGQDVFDLTSLTSEALTVATSATSTTTGSLPSIIRRSSAPEIEDTMNPDALSRISEVTTTVAATSENITSSAYSHR